MAAVAAFKSSVVVNRGGDDDFVFPNHLLLTVSVSTIYLENSVVSNLKVIIYFYFIAAVIVFRLIVLVHFSSPMIIGIM